MPLNSGDDTSILWTGAIRSDMAQPNAIADVACPAVRNLNGSTNGQHDAEVSIFEYNYASTTATSCRLAVVGYDTSFYHSVWFGNFDTANTGGEQVLDLPVPNGLSTLSNVTGWYIDCNLYQYDRIHSYTVFD